MPPSPPTTTTFSSLPRDLRLQIPIAAFKTAIRLAIEQPRDLRQRP
ncbi:hypothetical protein Vi05172_g7365 [Venturia inaequalis]|nr:hypothetical protein Vi05172_g7365 [Venturia inaequalis]